VVNPVVAKTGAVPESVAQTTPLPPHVALVQVIVYAVPSLTINVIASPAKKLVATGVRLAPRVIVCIDPLPGSTENPAASVIVKTSSKIVPVIAGSVRVLLVKVCVSVVPTKAPVGFVFTVKAEVPLPKHHILTKPASKLR